MIYYWLDGKFCLTQAEIDHECLDRWCCEWRRVRGCVHGHDVRDHDVHRGRRQHEYEPAQN